MKKMIRLTEADLHSIVRESVKRVLSEGEFGWALTNDDEYPYIIVHSVNKIGAGDVFKETPDTVLGWVQNGCGLDKGYIRELRMFIPEDFVNEEYYEYLGKYFDKTRFYYGVSVCPNRKYLQVYCESLDDLANDKCTICFNLRYIRGCRLSDILKLG